MNIEKIKAEINIDPEGRGYAGMTNAQVLADGKVIYQTTNRASLTGSEVLNAIDKGELDALSVTDKQMVWDLIHLGTLNPFGIEASLFVDIFGGGSVTVTTLQAIRLNYVDRWTKLGLQNVKLAHIINARE